MKIVFVFCWVVLWATACGEDSSTSVDGSDVDADSDTDTDTDTDGDTDTDADTDADTDTDSDSDSNTSGDTNEGTDSHGNGDTELPLELDTEYVDVSLKSAATNVQPMTGIVLWNDHPGSGAPEISLEYAYMGYDAVATGPDPSQWDWSGLEEYLDNVASHGHQAIVRFYFVYPGSETTVPAHIKENGAYLETSGMTEGQTTWFPDWSSSVLQNFVLTFYSELAARYDDDARLAFLQVGFGLWAEYHIYEPGVQLGVNFPDMAFQDDFITHLNGHFQTLHWSISIDAADESNTPFASVPGLRAMGFGLFDDSFLHEEHGDYNKNCFDFFGQQKRMAFPVGGELSYYSDYDQEHALDIAGPYEIPFETLAETYNVSYMIGNDQPDYQSMDRIKEAGMATGYRFELSRLQCSTDNCIASVFNRGIAPIYYDAYPAVDGVWASTSLQGLAPGQQQQVLIMSGVQDAQPPRFTIECERLVPGQTIQFDADL